METRNTEEKRALWRAAWAKRYEKNRDYILSRQRARYLRLKPYYEQYFKHRSTSLRTYVNNLKIGPCVDCKQSYPPYVMDFDHRADKKVSVSNMVYLHAPKELIDEEVAKCDLVCANCHRIRTHNRRQFTKRNAKCA